MSSAVLECREHGCTATFAGGSLALAEKFRARHEELLHAAYFDAIAPGMPAYQRHSITSLSAAQQVRAQSQVLREKVYEYLRSHGPATDQQMQDALRMDPSTQRPRRRELEQTGRVKDSGRTAKTHAGRAAVLWEAR